MSRQRISSCVPSSETSVMQESASGGMPAATAGPCITRAASWMQPLAEGWGLMTTASRALREMSALQIAVDVGFVDGMTAATTPMGSAISTTRRTGSSRRMPTVRSGRMYSWTSTAANRFLRVLSGTLPKPVSSCARRARRSASPRAASAAAATMRSTCSWEKPASTCWAALAFAASVLASWTERRSASRRPMREWL